MLLSTGCPSGRDDVGRFISGILSDPDVITLPVMRPFLFVFGPLIAFFRKKKVIRRYERIGGFRKLSEATDRLAAAMQERLGVEVRSAYRYSRPGFAETIKELRARGIGRVAVIPLNPQYSISTNGSFLGHLLQRLVPLGMSASVLPCFYRNDDFMDLTVEHIRAFVKEKGGDGGRSGAHYLFTAHSVPVRNLALGDPYVSQVESMARTLEERLGISGRASLAYQSSAGPIKWVGPDVNEKIRDLGARGVDPLFVFPLSFVVENLETLFDLDIALKETAVKGGVKQYFRVPVVGQSADFPDVLGRMARGLMAGAAPGGRP